MTTLPSAVDAVRVLEEIGDDFQQGFNSTAFSKLDNLIACLRTTSKPTADAERIAELEAELEQARAFRRNMPEHLEAAKAFQAAVERSCDETLTAQKHRIRELEAALAAQPARVPEGWRDLHCRFPSCSGAPVGVFHVPDGCHCWTDPLQALCAQHAVTVESAGPITTILDFRPAAPTPAELKRLGPRRGGK